MAIRVTQNMLYASSVSGMNRTLSDLMESNIQSASQLKINRPSDDPAGAGKVITLKATLKSMEIHQDNITAAQGWLSTADAILSSEGSVTTLLNRIKTLAQQISSGTYTAQNREQVSYELREDFKQLINIANSDYNGKHIFSGTKTDSPAFVMGLGVTCIDSGTGLDAVNFTASGSTDHTVIIQATSSGQADSATYRWTSDRGTTWHDVDPADIEIIDGKLRINAGDSGVSVFLDDPAAQVNAVNPDNIHSGDNGTWMYVRPTAIYQGDDNDAQVTLPYGSGTNTAAEVSAEGNFTRDVSVRIDDNDGTTVTYSYSLDDGSTWTQCKTPANAPMKMYVPGGYLNLDNQPASGEQYIIHPHRADINFAISSTDSITVNLVGKDVFGGIYKNPATGEYEVVENGGNIFEVVGDLIAAAETNSQQGVQEALAKLNDCMSVVLTKAAMVGGRENRLTMTASALSLRQFSEEDSLSKTQDVDFTELSTKLAMQQVAYNSVLKSSSMVMQMSLLNFL